MYTLQWTAVQDCGGTTFVMPTATIGCTSTTRRGTRPPGNNVVSLQAVSAVTASPSPFTPAARTSSPYRSLRRLEAILRPGSSTPRPARRRGICADGDRRGTYTATWTVGTTSETSPGQQLPDRGLRGGGSVRYYPTRTITVKAAVFAISASPDPFTPNGSNFTTITVLADPMQTAGP